MLRIISFFAKLISKHAFIFFIIGLLFTITCLSFSHVPEMDGALAGNLSKESSFYKVEQKIESIFHQSQVVHLKIVPKDQSLKDILNGLNQLEGELKSNFKIRGVNSILSFKQFYYLENIKEEMPFANQIEKLKHLPFLKHLISSDNKSLLVEVTMMSDSHFDLAAFDRSIQKDFLGIKNIKAISQFHIENAVAKYIQSDLGLFFILILIICSLVINYAFGSFSVVFYSIFMLFVSLSPIVLLMNIFSIKINIVTILAFPVVLIMALADMIHLLNGWQALRDMGKVINNFIFPSFLTSVAVMLEFLSLINNDIKNISEFGLIVSIAVMLEFVIVFLYAPYLMPKLKIKERPQSNFLLDTVAKLLYYKKHVNIILISGFFISLFLLPTLKFNTTIDSFLPLGSQVYKNHEEMNKDFNSLMNLSVLVEPPFYPIIDNFKWDSTDIAKVTYTLSDRIKKKSLVDSVYSINEIVDYAYAKNMTVDKWKTVNFTNPLNIANTYLIYAKVQHSDDIIPAFSQILPLKKSLENRANISFASPVLLFYEVDQALSRQLIFSILLSSITVMLIFYLLTNSVRKTCFAFFTNIIPVSYLAILFYLSHFDLNLVTSLTAVICLALIGDDSIHVLFRLCFRKDNDIGELGNGMITSTMILFFGFGSMIFSHFLPTRIFGLVCSVVFVIAMLSDLALLSTGVKKR